MVEFENRPLGTQLNKNTKDEANKQKPNRITSAETAADRDKMPKLTTSSHHIAKLPVVCRSNLTSESVLSDWANLHLFLDSSKGLGLSLPLDCSLFRN